MQTPGSINRSEDCRPALLVQQSPRDALGTMLEGPRGSCSQVIRPLGRDAAPRSRASARSLIMQGALKTPLTVRVRWALAEEKDKTA